MGLQEHAGDKEEQPDLEVQPEPKPEEGNEAEAAGGEKEDPGAEKKDEKQGAAKVVADLVEKNGGNPPMDVMVKAYNGTDPGQQGEFMGAVQELLGNEYATQLEKAAKGGEGEEKQDEAGEKPSQPLLCGGGAARRRQRVPAQADLAQGAVRPADVDPDQPAADGEARRVLCAAAAPHAGGAGTADRLSGVDTGFAPIPRAAAGQRPGQGLHRLVFAEKSGAPETIRTSDLCLRRATLYPAELRAPNPSDRRNQAKRQRRPVP